jgi:hypothetical protein
MKKFYTILFIHFSVYNDKCIPQPKPFFVSSIKITTQQLEIAYILFFFNNNPTFQLILFNAPPVSGLEHFKILPFGL